MRTTLTIDDDVLEAAKEIALGRKSTVGEALSELARRGLHIPVESLKYRNGVPLLPIRADGKVVTLELVNRLRDELP